MCGNSKDGFLYFCFTNECFVSEMRITPEIDAKIIAYLEEGHGVEKILEILHNNHYDVSRSSLYKHAARIRETGRYERQDGKLQIFLIADGRIFVLEVVAGREVHALMTTSLELSSWHPVKMGNVVTVQNVRLSRTWRSKVTRYLESP